ncbi:MAG: YrbL family protein [Kiritimatiellia bacterium]
MIELKHIKWLDQGANRVCYIHPDDPGKVLKIIKPWKRAELKRRIAPFYKRFRSVRCFDDNQQELKALRLLEKKKNASRHFPKCYGMVDTDLGQALCLEYVCSGWKEGEALSLEKYLHANGFTPEIMKALDDLFGFLYENIIITRDMRCFNIMVRYVDDKINLVIVDGLGNSEFIPVSNFIPAVGRLKIQRKFNRFKNRLDRIIGNNIWKIPALG